MEEKDKFLLKDFCKALKRRKAVFFTIVIISCTLSILLSFFLLKPTYEAKASIIIGKGGKSTGEAYSYNDIIMYQSLIKTYTEIASSEAVAEKTRSKLSIDLSTEQVLKAVTINAQSDTQVLMLKIHGDSPGNTLELAKDYTQSLIEECQSIFPNGEINVLDEAKLPEKPISPNKKVIILEVNAIGIMLAFIIILFLEYSDSSFKSEDEVKRNIGLNIIGRIPVLKGKKANYSSIKSLANSIRFLNSDSESKIISITGASPKEGKSFIAVKLAEAIACIGHKTALVDFTKRSFTVTNIYNLNEEQGVLDVLSNKVKYEDAVYESGKAGLYIMPIGSISEDSFTFQDNTLINLFSWLKEKYEYVIIDTSSILDESDTELITKYSDACILVTALNKTGRERAVLAKELLLRLNVNIIGVVINKCEAYKSLSHKVHKKRKKVRLGKVKRAQS